MAEELNLPPPYTYFTFESIAYKPVTPLTQSTGFTYISVDSSSHNVNSIESQASNQITLSSLPSEQIIPEFKLRFPPQKTFTCQFNQVKGQLNLLFNQTLQSIISIDISLKGDSLIVFNDFRDLTAKKDYYKNYHLFENRASLFSSTIPDGTDVIKGDSLIYDFKLQFPDVELLPSSCNQLNSKTDADSVLYSGTEAFLDIRYYLLLRIHFFSDTRALDYIDYVVPLLFQGDDSSNNWINKFINVDYERFLYQKKMKQYVYNKEETKMVSLSSCKPLGLGQIFSSKRKSKDVELRITVSIPQTINLQLGVNQIPIVIESPCSFAELQHFKVSGQNTGLGHFQVQQLIISIDNFTVYNVMSKQEDGTAVNQIFNSTDSGLHFDVADFHFVEKLGGFVWVTTLESLVCKSTSFAQLLGKPVMNTVKLEDYFGNINILDVRIYVSNGQDKHNQGHWFHFRRNVEIISQVPPNEVFQFYNSEFFHLNLETANFAKDTFGNEYRDPNHPSADGSGGGIINL